MSYSTAPQSKKTLEALWRLEKIILDTLNFEDVVQKIVDSTISELGYLELGYEIIVLCLVDTKNGILRRISVSKTHKAEKALERLIGVGVPFHEIVIPLSEKENLLIQAIEQNTPLASDDWYNILRPQFNEEQSRQIQSELGIKNSLIFPVRTNNASIGAMIFSMNKLASEVSADEMDLIKSFTDIVGLAVQNATIYTQLAKTKEELEKANEELKALDDLKDEFLSMASHELKSPMNAVKNYLWMALNKGLDNKEKQKEYLTIAYDSIQRLISLVNDLLDVSRIESGRVTLQIVPIDLMSVLKETIDIFEPQAKAKGLSLTSALTESVQVKADDTKLREILNNLVSNAIKYTPTGSVVVSATNRDEKVCISVTDTGAGITPADQAKLFQKFSRVNASYKGLATIEGTGLGLYISKQFVEMMGGTIGLDSAEGKGSTFWIELPKG